jgi:hypothetical protein
VRFALADPEHGRERQTRTGDFSIDWTAPA